MTDIDLSDLAGARDGAQPLRGYLASPPGTGPWPAMVMIREIFGLDRSCAATLTGSPVSATSPWPSTCSAPG